GFAEGPLELTVPRPRTPDLAGVTVHRRRVLLPGHVKILDGLPVTSVARTVFDLCGIVHPKRAERALDNCLSRKMVTVPALWRVLRITWKMLRDRPDEVVSLVRSALHSSS